MEPNLLHKSPSALLKNLSKILLESSMALDAKKKQQEDADDEKGKLILVIVSN